MALKQKIAIVVALAALAGGLGVAAAFAGDGPGIQTTSTAATDVRLIDQDVLVVIAFDRATADREVYAVTSFAL